MLSSCAVIYILNDEIWNWYSRANKEMKWMKSLEWRVWVGTCDLAHDAAAEPLAIISGGGPHSTIWSVDGPTVIGDVLFSVRAVHEIDGFHQVINEPVQRVKRNLDLFRLNAICYGVTQLTCLARFIGRNQKLSSFFPPTEVELKQRIVE